MGLTAPPNEASLSKERKQILEQLNDGEIDVDEATRQLFGAGEIGEG